MSYTRNEMLMLNTDFPINRVLEVRKNQPDVAWFFALNSHMMMDQLSLYKFVHSKLFAVRQKKSIFVCRTKFFNFYKHSTTSGCT